MKKQKTDIRPYLGQFYRGNIGYLLLSFVQTLLLVAANLLISWLMQQIIDLIGGKDTGFSFGQIIWLSLLGLLISVAAFVVAHFSRPQFMAKAIAQYKNYVFSQLSKKSISAFSGENTALYISALSNDVTAIENGYLRNIFTIIDECALCVGALALMFYYSPALSLVSIALTVVPLLASILTGNLVAVEEKRVSDNNESYMSTLRDSLTGFSVVKSFRAEKQMCTIFAQKVRDVANAQERRQKMSILVQGCAMTAGIILQIGVFLIGAWLALSGSGISAGSVLVFVQLLNYVINPIGSVPQALAECKASRALITKLADALSGNVRQEGAVSKHALADAITVENLSFGYEPGEPILHDLSFRFEAGKSYCLVGVSGSGKSTLLNLLMASYHNYSGSIRYDDVELQEISSEALYEMVSVVQQNVFIFNASIRDNITMFSQFPRDAVDKAMELSGLSGLIRSRGEDYLCGENGAGLSGGEKQRISIARSLLKNAQVLLVDEATAALDVQTAAQVSGAILDLDGLTRIVVTHSLEESLLKRYDCILTLKNGRITEAGSFEELMAQKGYFYSLFTVSQ